MEKIVQPSIESVEINATSSGVASFLRFIGSCLLIVGAISYLLEGWYAVGHVSRYIKFLGVTGLLSTAGVLTALKLKENRGARTFLVLAAAALPVNFCQLGALLYSTMPFKAVPDTLTPYLLWQAPSLSIALTITGASLIALSAIGWLSFSVLGRQGRSLLFPAIIGLNSLLLIPIRAVEPVSILALGAAYCAYEVSRRLRSLYSFEYTFEGIFCRVLLWVPSSILLLRTAVIYDQSAVLNGVLCLYIGGVALAGSRMLDSDKGLTGLLDFVGGSFLVTGLLTEQYVLFKSFGITHENELLPLMILGLTVTGELVSRYLKNSASAVRGISYGMAVLLALGFMLDSSGSIAMVLPLVVGGLGLLFVRKTPSRFIATLAILTSVAGFLHMCAEVIPNLFDSWFTISLVGVFVVFVSSLIEKELIIPVRELLDRAKTTDE